MAKGPIPWSSIKAFCNDRSFIRVIRAMDNFYLSFGDSGGLEMTKEKFRQR